MSDLSLMIKGTRIRGLDGLRGLAVAAVVLFHAWPDTVRGGWIGVSVFFTLSGYLITGIVVREHELSRASLASFWRRRVRRLLPPALVTIGVVVAITAVTELDSLADVGRDGIAALFYVANWRQAAAPGGYGAIFETAIRPFAHLWSLSIEEQVYIFWPVTLLVLGVRRALALGVLIVAAGTVIWWGSPDAYFATPLRFGEVLTGAALAIVPVSKLDRPTVRIAGVVAGGVLLVLIVTMEETATAIGHGAMPAIGLLSMAVVAAVIVTPNERLSNRPLEWLGHRSYAIYLFHWPLLVLTELNGVFVIVFSLALAEVSHRFVEWPIRTGARVKHPFVAIGGASIGLAGLVFIATLAAPTQPSDAEITANAVAAFDASAPTDEAALALDGEPRNSPTEQQPPPTASVEDPGETGGVEESSAAAESDSANDSGVSAREASRKSLEPTVIELVEIVLPDDPTILVVGDSAGEALHPALLGWAEALGFELQARAWIQCSPMFNERDHEAWTTLNFGPLEVACRPEIEDGIDAVLVFDHGVVLVDHYSIVDDLWVSITDDLLFDAIRAEYEFQITVAAEKGAEYIFTTPPKPFSTRFNISNMTEPLRLDRYLRLIRELADTYDHVSVIEFGRIVDADAATYVRTDGLHLDRDTSAITAIADLIAPVFVIP